MSAESQILHSYLTGANDWRIGYHTDGYKILACGRRDTENKYNPQPIGSNDYYYTAWREREDADPGELYDYMEKIASGLGRELHINTIGHGYEMIDFNF